MKLNTLIVVLSSFDAIRGPIVLDIYPRTLDKTKQKVIGMKTIDILHDDEKLSKKQTIMDFPSIEMKGLVKAFNLTQKKNKEFKYASTITVLFEEREDAIFYRYNDDFTQIFDQFINIIEELPINSIFDFDFSKELSKFYQNVQSTIDSLSQIDFPSKSNLAFPVSKSNGNEPSMYFKITVVGDPRVGKTSTILRYTDNTFRRSYISTIGANLSIKDVVIEGEYLELILYDLAGQQKYSSVRRQFYQGSDGIIIIFDLTCQETFESVPFWYKDLQHTLPNFSDIPVIICGNKSDLQDQIDVNEQNVKKFTDSINVPYFQISAFTGKNNSMIFDYILNACWNKLKIKRKSAK